MSDYSFMKTGYLNTSSNGVTEDEKLNIISLVSLFGAKAIEHATDYIYHCGREGITKLDLVYGMRYEAFEYMKNPNLYEEANKMKDEIIEQDDEDSDWEDIDDLILPDDKIQPFIRINDSKINDENREFIDKMHTYYDQWDRWEPQTPLENILKRAIDRSNI